MAHKITVMVMKVDLQCYRCYNKVKKVLCKFPEVWDQVYNEKQNTVTITVVCCYPEKIRDKLSYKGGKTIKSIEIKPKEPEKPKASEKPKEPEKPKSNGNLAPAPTPVPVPKAPEATPPLPLLAPMIQVVPFQGYPSIFPYEGFYEPFLEDRAVGPYYIGYGRPEPNYGNYGYNNYGYGPYNGGRPYVYQCDYYANDGNNSACTIM